MKNTTIEMVALTEYALAENRYERKMKTKCISQKTITGWETFTKYKFFVWKLP